MTAHELAQRLLSGPDLIVTIYNGDHDDYDEVKSEGVFKDWMSHDDGSNTRTEMVVLGRLA